MCCCAKANRNGQPGYSWDGKTPGTRPVQPPEVPAGWTILYDEPGRCRPMVGGAPVRVDHHSHHYRVVREDVTKETKILVQHGGGREEIGDSYNVAKFAKILALLPDSDARFYALMAWDGSIGAADRTARDSEAHRWRAAIADGRARKRRYPKRGTTRVWIEEGPRTFDVSE